MEDLCGAITTIKENDAELIVAMTRSPFNREIHEVRLSKGMREILILKTILIISTTLWSYI